MSTQMNCPQCSSPYAYELEEGLMICPECNYEWNIEEEQKKNQVLDSNGNPLENGDTVIIIKDLPVKGAPKPIKIGTKVKNIILHPGEDHDISCRIEGFGPMAIKSEFVKKA